MENNKKSLFKTFLSYSIPCIVAMFLTSFITVVDGAFIGWKVGEKGLAAINLTLPVLYVLLAVTILIGVGGVTLAAQFLGAKNHLRANSCFTFSMVVNAVVNIAAMIVLAVFDDEIINMLNAKGIMFGYVKDYMGTMTYFYIFMMMNMTFSMFIRSEGKPQLSLFFGIAGNVLNIILDYILIVKLDGGMRGAALASGISVLIPFILGVAYFLSKKSVFKFSKFTFDFNELKQMLFLGLAESVAQISISITTFAFNFILLRRVGINGVAALTIVGYISFIQNMILTGIAIGIHPVISYNFGAKNREVILDLLSIAIKAAVVVGIVVFAAAFAAAGGIAGIFAGGNTELMKLASYGLRLFSISFILNGFNIIAAAYFTSIGDAKAAAVISILRSLVLVLVFILILPNIIGDAGIWLTAPLTELTTFIVAYAFLGKSKARLNFESGSRCAEA